MVFLRRANNSYFLRSAITSALILVVLLSLSGCGESAAELAFRAELVDRALNDENSRAGKSFLLENKQLKGVITTNTGLQYQVVSSGAGKQPQILDRVKVHYEGRLISGELFDSSYKRGNSSTFPLREVLAGWRQALLKMREGDHWIIYLPANLAYGARSPSAKIAANSALIFDIKLLTVLSEKHE